ncbi:Zona pellucida domain-containing protein [Strongyloides ratti]|uniref:Zona pellucida domain-containing protein n=1 Tax=Strongyloides ratti TaxID=34506 RepID=A0A090MYU0_STRRB|nr:Zona pellucida domain-containing protein [Strongyloides ratti]CEF67769.1 Zona pellucida domain-containing protein [Strongyloides ratti]
MLSYYVKVVNNYVNVIFYCFLFLIYFTISIKAIDNKLNYSVQNLQCNEKEFKLFLNFSSNFDGVIFGKDYFQDKKCKWYNNKNKIEISIDTTMCGIKKIGDEYEFSIIISPEKNIIVEGAKEVLLKCLPTENFKNIPENDEVDEIVISLDSSQNISSKLKFTPITPSTLTGNGYATKVSLQILRQHDMKGSLAKDAKIGEPLTMNVHLEDTKLYNIMLSDCYAHDGKGNDKAILKIIDSQGCSVPLARAVKENVTTQIINGNEKNIFINIYGFQFTSNNNVYFECKVKTCIQPCFVKQCENNTKTISKEEKNEKEFTNIIVKYMLEIKP